MATSHKERRGEGDGGDSRGSERWLSLPKGETERPQCRAVWPDDLLVAHAHTSDGNLGVTQSARST